MAQSKNLSKGASKNKSIESTNTDNNSSCSTTLDKSVQSTNLSNIVTTYIDTANNKSKSLSNGSWNLSYCFIYSSFIHVISCSPKGNLCLNFILKKVNNKINILDQVPWKILLIMTKVSSIIHFEENNIANVKLHIAYISLFNRRKLEGIKRLE